MSRSRWTASGSSGSQITFVADVDGRQTGDAGLVIISAYPSDGRIKEVVAPPNLIEIQIDSYREFLQLDAAPSRRKNVGLQAVFTEVFPIESYDGKVSLDFHSYEIGEPKLTWLECLREGITYGAPLHVTFLLKQEKGTTEEKVFMGELPLMTPQGIPS